MNNDQQLPFGQRLPEGENINNYMRYGQTAEQIAAQNQQFNHENQSYNQGYGNQNMPGYQNTAAYQNMPGYQNPPNFSTQTFNVLQAEQALEGLLPRRRWPFTMLGVALFLFIGLPIILTMVGAAQTLNGFNLNEEIAKHGTVAENQVLDFESGTYIVGDVKNPNRSCSFYDTDGNKVGTFDYDYHRTEGFEIYNLDEGSYVVKCTGSERSSAQIVVFDMDFAKLTKSIGYFISAIISGVVGFLLLVASIIWLIVVLVHRNRIYKNFMLGIYR